MIFMDKVAGNVVKNGPSIFPAHKSYLIAKMFVLEIALVATTGKPIKEATLNESLSSPFLFMFESCNLG